MEAERGIGRNLKTDLERLARSLGDKGVVIKPFSDEAKHIFPEVLAKSWSREQRGDLEKTPCVLMLSSPFAEFNPSEDRYAVFNLQSANAVESSQITAAFVGVSRILNDTTEDPIELLKTLALKLQRGAIIDAFSLPPNFNGFGVDLKKLLKVLREYHSEKRSSGFKAS